MTESYTRGYPAHKMTLSLGGNTWVNVTSMECSETRDAIDVTSCDSSGIREFISGLKTGRGRFTWNVGITGFSVYPDIEATYNDNAVAAVLTFGTDTGAKIVTVNVVVTNMTITGTVGGALTGTGEFTMSAASAHSTYSA